MDSKDASFQGDGITTADRSNDLPPPSKALHRREGRDLSSSRNKGDGRCLPAVPTPTSRGERLINVLHERPRERGVTLARKKRCIEQWRLESRRDQTARSTTGWLTFGLMRGRCLLRGEGRKRERRGPRSRGSQATSPRSGPTTITRGSG